MQWGIYAAAGGALFFAGIGGGFLLFHEPAAAGAEMNRQGGYEFVNPLLTCDLLEDEPYGGFGSLTSDLQSAVKQEEASGAVTRMSVYFRDMNYGRWTGVNADDLYIPASLNKVPLYIAYQRQAQTSPAVLTQTYTIPAGVDANSVETFKSQDDLLPGVYTVQQLLDAMIMHSDNNAANVLNAHVSPAAIADVYSTLSLPAGDDNAEDMSPRGYMVLFRILYNATYIGRTRAQATLKLLSETDFNGGIVAGVGSTTVSHKFGERSVYVQDGATGQQTLTKRELHDCGIVYYPGSPYGLCIMTEGADFNQMKGAIADVSALVYKDVQAGLLR